VAQELNDNSERTVRAKKLNFVFMGVQQGFNQFGARSSFGCSKRKKCVMMRFPEHGVRRQIRDAQFAS
jgi:hypothetical protein